MKPLALGYLRTSAADAPETVAALTNDMQVYADREGLTLADVYTDLIDPPDGSPDRAGFCAMMDAVRRGDTYAVVIPSPDHLSRRPSCYMARRTIIEAEGGAQLLVIDAGSDPPFALDWDA